MIWTDQISDIYHMFCDLCNISGLLFQYLIFLAGELKTEITK